VNKHYSTHTTSATIEFRKNEIKDMACYMVDNLFDMEFISFASLPRFESNNSYPRLPFEPITDEEYLERISEISHDSDFYKMLCTYDQDLSFEIDRGTNACDSVSCQLK
jgi:ribonucleotide reductase class II